VLEAGLAEMDVAVDHAGQHVHPARIDLVSARTQVFADRIDQTISDREVGPALAAGRDQGAVADNEFGRHDDSVIERARADALFGFYGPIQ